MNYSNVDIILSESVQKDWIVDDESGSFTYREDLNLHIERASYESYSQFNEPWATNHPDPEAMSVVYIVRYGSSFVRRYNLVSVDGHRATLPMPKSKTDLRVTASDLNFAKIVDIGGDTDSYMHRSGLSVI